MIRIRKAGLSDADAITGFNIRMALETEGVSLNPETVSKGVRSLMELPQYGFYIVAEDESAIAGSLMITYEWSDWRNAPVWWIQSVYVDKAFRRSGVFSRMYEFVEQTA